MGTLLATNVVYTPINIERIKFISYIYIPFSQNFDDKSYISAKIKAIQHLKAVFSSNCGTAPTSNQTVEGHC